MMFFAGDFFVWTFSSSLSVSEFELSLLLLLLDEELLPLFLLRRLRLPLRRDSEDDVDGKMIMSSSRA
jgi:hypothetical protein